LSRDKKILSKALEKYGGCIAILRGDVMLARCRGTALPCPYAYTSRKSIDIAKANFLKMKTQIEIDKH
jgi:hypothetical protein